MQRKPKKTKSNHTINTTLLKRIQYQLSAFVRENSFGENRHDALSPGKPAETVRIAIILALHYRAKQPAAIDPALIPKQEVLKTIDWAWNEMPQTDIALLKRRSPHMFRLLLSHWWNKSSVWQFVTEVGN